MGIARKEAVETMYWLRLTMATGADTELGEALLDEATQLVRILSAIVRKSRKALES